jgi:hypothetical protein
MVAVSEKRRIPVFIPTDHSKLHTEVASSGWLSTRHTSPSRRKDAEVRRDIGNGDGTVDNHNKQDIDDLDKETKAL